MRFMNVAKKYGSQLVVGGSMVLASASALAQTDPETYLPEGIDTAFTQMQTNVGTLSGYAWPIVILVTFTLAGIGLFKKFGRKAAG